MPLVADFIPASIADAARSGWGRFSVAVSPSTASGEEDMAKLFGDAAPSTQDLARLAEDKKAQSLSGARIIRLAQALELGRRTAVHRTDRAQLSRQTLSRPALEHRRLPYGFGFLSYRSHQGRAFRTVATLCHCRWTISTKA